MKLGFPMAALVTEFFNLSWFQDTESWTLAIRTAAVRLLLGTEQMKQMFKQNQKLKKKEVENSKKTEKIQRRR